MTARIVKLQISEADFEFAQAKAERDGFSGPEDCLNGILNMALLHHRNPDDGSADERQLSLLRAEKRALQETLILLSRQSSECNLPHCDGSCFAPHQERGLDQWNDDIPF